ncbi:YegP family protein [Nevskia sp.]|uniref:YegP family protein n=1 Tax=Nevskia sp. TaxID=1929292 RepID=UPI0025D4FB81|nr:YegP family protein [Nevskia sp.]
MGTFELKKSESGKFHFNLKAGNGQIVATSQMYASKESALNGIESVRKNAPDAKLEDLSEA